jgi:hypothetical protein
MDPSALGHECAARSYRIIEIEFIMNIESIGIRQRFNASAPAIRGQ